MPVTAACGRRRVPPPPQRRDPSPAVQHSVRLQQSPGHARSLRLYAWPCGRAVSVAWCGSQARLCARFGRLWALICELLGSFVRMQILLPQSGLRRPVPRRGGSPQQRLPGRPPRSGGPLADAEHTGSATPPVQGSPTRLCVFARAAAKGLHANTQRGGSLANAEQVSSALQSQVFLARSTRVRRTEDQERKHPECSGLPSQTGGPSFFSTLSPLTRLKRRRVSTFVTHLQGGSPPF